MGLLGLNIVMTLHLGHIRPFNTVYLNRIYLFNEYMIGVVSAHMLFFSDWLPEQHTQHQAGWSMCYWIIFTIIVNMLFVLYWFARSIWLLLVKYYRLYKYFRELNSQREEEDSLEIIHIPDEPED